MTANGRRIFVNGRFLTQPMTGVQRYAFNVVKRLPPSEITVLSPAQPRQEYRSIPQLPVRALAGTLPSHLWEQIALPWPVDRRSVLWSPAGLGSFFARRTVLTIHDLAVLEMPFCYGNSTRAWYSTFYPYAARRASRILTVSEYSKEAIVRVLGIPRHKISVTPLGVEDVFRPATPDRIEAVLAARGITPPYILAVGAVSARKNFDRLLSAWRQISTTLRGLTLVIVGEEGLFFSNGSSLGRADSAMHIGRVSDDELAALYSGATAFVLPSIYEGFGLPVLEAMACGAPVITSNVTSLPEVAGDAAVLIDPFDVASIADAIVAVTRDKKFRAELRERGFERARSFSWDATASATWDVLRETLD